LLSEQWNIKQAATCVTIVNSQKRIYKVPAAYDDESYVVYARLPQENAGTYSKMNSIMKFVDFLDASKVQCGSFLEPGLFQSELIQVSVNREVKG